MIEVISPDAPTLTVRPAQGSSELGFDSFGALFGSDHELEHAEFRSIFANDTDGDSGFNSTDGGVLQLVRNVEAGRADMQSAVLRASLSPDPQNTFEAMKALSKYDLQTLLLSKVSNKVFQAVDRLTNLS